MMQLPFRSPERYATCVAPSSCNPQEALVIRRVRQLAFSPFGRARSRRSCTASLGIEPSWGGAAQLRCCPQRIVRPRRAARSWCQRLRRRSLVGGKATRGAPLRRTPGDFGGECPPLGLLPRPEVQPVATSVRSSVSFDRAEAPSVAPELEPAIRPAFVDPIDVDPDPA